MPKVESTILDYTKSVEELRLFELSEKCREIAREYESYNIRNGIYEAFGEWFLEEAKDSYNTTFGSYDLARIIRKKDIEPPEVFLVECNYGDYDKCESLREICVNVGITTCRCESNYTWYTMWQIAKAYNGKHGCVVTEPTHITPSNLSSLSICIDWSQNSIDCITREKWMEEAKENKGSFWDWGLFGAVLWALIWFVWLCIVLLSTDEFIGIAKLFVPAIPFFMVFALPFRKVSIRLEAERLSSDFTKHCQNINETKFSKFDVRIGKIMRY